MTGYNNYFPQSYTNSLYGYNGMQTQPMSAPVASTNQISGINWVQGVAGARSVPLTAGQKTMLMDSETNVFYVKSADQTGMPLPLRAFRYQEINLETGEVIEPARSEYVTHDELKKVLEELKQNFAPKKEEKTNEFVI